MAKIERGFFDVGYTDILANQKTFVHQLDPRIKLITTMIFIATVVSFGKYEISALTPFVLYPVFFCTFGNIPYGFILKKVLLVSPFALMIGIFNPLIDTQIHYILGTFNISGGWISFISIMLRFILTVGSALSLIAVTGFNSVCMAMEKMKLPRVFTVQLMFLHRYLFLLTSEASKMIRAASLRKPDSKGINFKVFVSLLGHLLIRTLDRAQRIHLAMHCRGFQGRIVTSTKLKMGFSDVAFFIGWTVLFVCLRFFNLPQFLGNLITGIIV